MIVERGLCGTDERITDLASQKGPLSVAFSRCPAPRETGKIDLIDCLTVTWEASPRNLITIDSNSIHPDPVMCVKFCKRQMPVKLGVGVAEPPCSAARPTPGRRQGGVFIRPIRFSCMRSSPRRRSGSTLESNRAGVGLTPHRVRRSARHAACRRYRSRGRRESGLFRSFAASVVSGCERRSRRRAPSARHMNISSTKSICNKFLCSRDMLPFCV